jgi:hypothetical protein
MKTMSLTANPIPINWRPDLPIFASEPFLKTVSDEYGWIGGRNDSGKLCCVLPYAVIRKAMFSMVRFQSETIPLGEKLGVEEEKSFLDSTVKYFSTTGTDMIIPATTNTICQAYPEGAIAAPYGTYVIDLSQSEESIWSNLTSSYRSNIRNATKHGVEIRNGLDHADIAYTIVRDTFKRSGLPFMGHRMFERMLNGLGENVKVLIADYEGVTQSCSVIPFSRYCAYGLYGGSIDKAKNGAFKLIQWEAIKMFRAIGVNRFDFLGVRINPEKGSKQEGIMLFKQHFGAELVQGYIWKYSFHPLSFAIYSLAVRLLRGGDIVDQEKHKLDVFKPGMGAINND